MSEFWEGAFFNNKIIVRVNKKIAGGFQDTFGRINSLFGSIGISFGIS
ncbi:MAG: hypothetical protein NT166_09820 [Candidatus Aminicenantes bacterium]|nr:hypothetical protein [Candidatus Aminicenantes bacterium]